MDAVIHQLPHVAGYSTRTSADKAAAHAADKETHAELRALRSNDPMNKSCCDCTATLSGWASLPHGVFLCIGCAQVHRSLGRHMAQVKSFSSGTYLWYPDEVAAMRLMGNLKANALYASPEKGAPPKPDKDAPSHVKDNYIRDKYERLKWVDPEFSYSSKSKALKKWVRKGKETFAATSSTVKSSWKKKKVAAASTESRTLSATSTSAPSSTTAPNSTTGTATATPAGFTVVSGQPQPTSAVYGGYGVLYGGGGGGGGGGGSLLDDDRSTHGCLAPVLFGLAAFKPAKSRWSCNSKTSYGTTHTATTARKDDFFASWGL